MAKTPEGDFLDSQDFYELMQRYRHSPAVPQESVVQAFEAVKEYVRKHFVSYKGE